MQSLLYDSYDIVFQEVPDEITLAINITGCPHRCPGCHSEHLWVRHGWELLKSLPLLLDKYTGLITAVCLMGGDQNMYELIEAAKCIRRNSNYKICIYTGMEPQLELFNLLPYVDYLKFGPYKQELGGLDSPTTNQRMIAMKGGLWCDITDKFRKRPH